MPPSAKPASRVKQLRMRNDVVLTVEGDHSHSHSLPLREVYDHTIQAVETGATRVVVYFAIGCPVTSSDISILLGAYQCVSDAERIFGVACAEKQTRKSLETMGLDRVFEIASDPSEILT